METSPELGQPPEGSALRVGLALLVVVGTPAGIWLWQRRVRAAYLLLQRVCCCNMFAVPTPTAATAAAEEDGALDDGPAPMANKSITARLCFDTEPQVCTTAPKPAPQHKHGQPAVLLTSHTALCWPYNLSSQVSLAVPQNNSLTRPFTHQRTRSLAGDDGAAPRTTGPPAAARSAGCQRVDSSYVVRPLGRGRACGCAAGFRGRWLPAHHQPWFNMALEYPAGIRLLMWDQLANVKAARPGLGSADAIQCSTCRLIIVAHDRGHGIVCLRFPTS